MQLPVTRDVAVAELEVAQNILIKWLAELKDGIPGIEKPASAPDAVEDWVKSFCGELMIVAGKCENLANVMSGQF